MHTPLHTGTPRLANHVTLATTLLALLITPAFQLPVFSQNTSNPSNAPKTINDVFAQIGDRVPAFGGMFVDESQDTLYVYVVPGQSGNVAEIDQALSDVLGTARPPQHRLVALEGQYTFVQLNEWLDSLTPQVLSIAGAEFTDISQSNNRLEIGVGSATAIPAVEAALAALAIPRGAVLLEASPLPDTVGTLPEPDDNDAENPKTLRDQFSPPVGGLQIAVATKGISSYATCTMAFPATLDKVPGVVTNEHCIVSDDQRHLYLNVFYQPSPDEKYRIGVASVAPSYFKHAQNEKCPDNDTGGRFCRYSDSSFAKLDKGVEAPVGFIAKPASGFEWDGKAQYRVVATVKPEEGMAVTRVSSQSGIDNGKVSNTCRNINTKDKKGYDTGITLLCQVSVSWDSKVLHGDSGSPVFTAKKDSDDVKLMGVLWGDTGVSSIEQIQITGTELGPKLLVCAAGFDC